MLKFIILLFCLEWVGCDEFDTVDKVAASTFKIGDPTNLFGPNAMKTKLTCSIATGAPSAVIDLFNRLVKKKFSDSPSIVDLGAIGMKPYLNSSKIATCKVINRDGMPKAKELFEKIDKHINKTKMLRDQYMAAITEASQPNTTTTLAQFNCYGKQWMKKTIEIFPEEGGQRAFIKDYMNYMYQANIDFVSKKEGKPVDKCELPPPSPNPPKYKSIPIAGLFAMFNIMKKSAGKP